MIKFKTQLNLARTRNVELESDLQQLEVTGNVSIETLELEKAKTLDLSNNKKRTFLKWEMSFYAFKSKQIIMGMSEINYNETGKIISHHDYWDSLNGIFIKLPFIGFLYKASLKIFSMKY